MLIASIKGPRSQAESGLRGQEGRVNRRGSVVKRVLYIEDRVVFQSKVGKADWNLPATLISSLETRNY